MSREAAVRIIAATILLISLLAACGQTGPLYLPGEAPPPRATSTPVGDQPANAGEPAQSAPET